MYTEIKVRHLNKIRIGDNSAECCSTCSKEQDSLLKFDSSRDRLCTGAVRMPGRVGLSFASGWWFLVMVWTPQLGKE